MSQAGYTPIQLYYSTTAAAVPVNTNLANGELAINITDGKLYYKDNGGTVRLLASNATSAPVLSFQTSLSGLTPSTATTGVVTLAGTLGAASGGTGLTTLATGSLTYGAGTSPFSTLAIGTAGQILTVNSGATAPQWSTLSGVAVTTFSAGTTGFTPSSATAGAVTLAGTLATTNGGTGLTSFTSGGVVYASSTSALATSSALTFDGTILKVLGAANEMLRLDTTSTAYDASIRIFQAGVQKANIQAGVGVTGGGLQIESSGSTPIVFANSSELMRLSKTSTGTNLLVGTTSSTFSAASRGVIEVAGSSTALVSLKGSSALAYIFNDGGNLNIANESAGVFQLSNNGAVRLQIGSAGQLGIGGATYGTNGQVLTSGGSGAAPTWATSASSQWTTSGSDIFYNTGNVAVGSAPQTYSLGKALEVGFAGNGINGASQTQVTFIGNAYYNSGWKYGGTGKAAFMQLDAGNIIWYNTDTSGTAGASISTFAERMRIDTVGRGYIGPSRPTTDAQFSATLANNNSSSIVVAVRGGVTADVYPGVSSSAAGYFANAAFNTRYGVYGITTNSGYGPNYGGYFVNAGTSTEDSAGVYAEGNQADSNGFGIVSALYAFGKTTIGAGNNGFAVGVYARTNDYVDNINILASSDYTGGSTQTVMRVRRNGSNIGSITTTTTATAYNTSSDHRLKNSIAPMTGALAKVAQLKPCTYKWNSNGSDGEGFIAHELAEVVPCAVTGVKDEIKVEKYVIEPEEFNVNITPAEFDADGNEITPAKNEKIVTKPAVMGSREVPVYQSIDTSFLVATLTAAIQEQQAIIESLKARLDAANL